MYSTYRIKLALIVLLSCSPLLTVITLAQDGMFDTSRHTAGKRTTTRTFSTSSPPYISITVPSNWETVPDSEAMLRIHNPTQGTFDSYDEAIVIYGQHKIDLPLLMAYNKYIADANRKNGSTLVKQAIGQHVIYSVWDLTDREFQEIRAVRMLFGSEGQYYLVNCFALQTEFQQFEPMFRKALATIAFSQYLSADGTGVAAPASDTPTNKDGIDWDHRQNELTQQYVSKFKSPAIGSTVTVELRIGGVKIGKLTALASTTLSLDEMPFSRDQLTSESRPRFFAVDWARFAAKEKVAKEKAEYESNLAKQRVARQAVVAEQTRKLSEATQQAKAEQSYEQAVSQLETAIKENPEAEQLSQARSTLSAIQDEHTAALEDEQRKQTEAAERLRQEKAQAEEAVADAMGKAHADEIPSTVNGLLREQAKGKLGYEYWADSRLGSRLYAPASWEIMDTQALGSLAIVKVRIESSTDTGSPIRKLWTFHLKYKGGWKVSMITE